MKTVVKLTKKGFVFIIIILFVVYGLIIIYSKLQPQNANIIDRNYIIEKVSKLEKFEERDIRQILRFKNEEDIKKISKNLENVKVGDFLILFDSEYWIYDMYQNVIKAKIKYN